MLTFAPAVQREWLSFYPSWVVISWLWELRVVESIFLSCPHLHCWTSHCSRMKSCRGNVIRKLSFPIPAWLYCTLITDNSDHQKYVWAWFLCLLNKCVCSCTYGLSSSLCFTGGLDTFHYLRHKMSIWGHVRLFTLRVINLQRTLLFPSCLSPVVQNDELWNAYVVQFAHAYTST